MTFQQFKFRVHFAWQILLGKYEPSVMRPFFKDKDLRDQALKFALDALENIGKRHHGGSVDARKAHAMIVKRLHLADIGGAL